MNKAKKQPAIDPDLFEYNPEEADDEEVMQCMAERGVSPDVIVDPKERETYIKFLEKFNAAAD